MSSSEWELQNQTRIRGLPPGWFVGFPEYLRLADMPAFADRMEAEIADRFVERPQGEPDRGYVAFTEEEADALADFMVYRFIRAVLN